MEWVLYYPDGSCYTSADGAPWESPPHPVVGVCQPDTVTGREICHGDWYIYHTDKRRWSYHDREGALAQLVYRGPMIGCTRPGWFVASPDEWRALLDRMRTDVNGLPPHSAYAPRLRRE